MTRTLTAALALGLFACGGPPPSTPARDPAAPSGPSGASAAPASAAASSATPSSTTPPSATPPSAPALDERAIVLATGAAKADVAPDGVVKVSFPRKDVEVAIDGWKMPPFMGLTSWAAFAPGKGGAQAMVMGDLVLFEDEVNPVMSALLEGGASVTALHNHFFYDVPNVYFMHIGGEGSVETLGRAVRAAIEKTAAIRKSAPKPASGFGSAPLPAKSTLDAAKLETALGRKGQASDGMFKAVIGRAATASCGCTIGKTMGVNTWAAFAGTEDNAVVDGDFAVTEAELQPVLRSLRSSGVNIVAIHHHMSGETPRILFLHYWGRGKSADLAAAVRRALELTAGDKS